MKLEDIEKLYTSLPRGDWSYDLVNKCRCYTLTSTSKEEQGHGTHRLDTVQKVYHAAAMGLMLVPKLLVIVKAAKAVKDLGYLTVIDTTSETAILEQLLEELEKDE